MQVPDFKRVNNEKDPIPIVPGRFLGFQHPHGEIHIIQPGEAVSCPGDDDATDAQCTIETVPNITEATSSTTLALMKGSILAPSSAHDVMNRMSFYDCNALFSWEFETTQR